MKKYFILLAAALLAVACNQEELQDPEGNAVEIPSNGFLAGFEANVKVALQDDWSLAWEVGDGVAIYNGETFSEYLAQTAGASTTLLGEDVADVAHCAFYPYSEDLVFEGTSVTAVIPSEQTPKIGNFPYNPSVAYVAAGNKSLAFYNICGLVGFEITADEVGVSNVVIYGNNNEVLTGGIKVDCNSTTPKAAVVEGKGVQSVTLQAEGTFEPGVYYVAVLPQKFEQGITITMNATDGKQYKKTSKPFTLNRSHRINASNINDGEFGAENLISNAAELQAFFNVVNADENKGAGMVGKIVADIDMSTLDHFAPAAEFAGTLDGSYTDGENTSNWTISNFNTTTALIGKLSETGVVKNITVSGNLTINANDDAAFIVLDNAGTISYCKTQGKAETAADLVFENERAVGAIAARTSGTIEYCTNEAAITLKPKGTATLAEADAKAGTTNGIQHLGGVVGYATGNTAVIDHCTNTAQVAYTAECPVNTMTTIGGVLGSTDSEIGNNVAAGTFACDVTISNCNNSGKLIWTYSQKPAGNAYNNLLMGGIVGYLEGPISDCTNSGEIYAHGWRTTDTGSCYTKVVKIGGVAGVANKDVTNCTNAAGGNIDFSSTITSGDLAAKYIGNVAYGTIGGVVASSGSDSYIVSGCNNNAETMSLDMHMLPGNNSGASAGGVVGYLSSQIKNCSNNADVTIDSRIKNFYFGGVSGYTNITKTPENCNNYGDITIDAGELEDKSNQSNGIYFGGVFAHVQKCNLNITGTVGFVNEGDLKLIGGSTEGTKYIGGIIGYAKAAGGTFSLRGSVERPFGVNRGSITAENIVGLSYVAGVHGYLDFETASTKGNDAVTMNNSSNEGAINVTTSAESYVSGIIGYYKSGCVYGSVNSGDITVTSSGGNLRVAGAVASAENAKRLVGMINEGDIVVTTTSADAVVRVAGVRTADNGQMNSTAQRSSNSGDISLITNAKDARIAGVATQDGATQIHADNSGNVSFEYTGEKVSGYYAYASLGVAYRAGSTATVSGTYSGALTLKGIENTVCYYGLLGGWVKEGTGMNVNAVKIKKGTVINGVSVSSVDTDQGYYKNRDFLFSNLNPSNAVLTMDSLSLID